MQHERDALITGIGLISCLGEGADAHWAALNDPNGFQPVLDRAGFAPYAVHPMTALTLDKQIPKRGDQRQMEAWQRIGTYAAGAALESAGIKGDTAILERTDMIVAAGGGERDYAVDQSILSALPKAENPGAYLNEHLLGDIRPTLFLAQLSNLLAGTISLVHGVIGSSRTFMGEETSGADAVRIACARIGAGSGDIFLVGGSYNAQRADVLLHYAMGRTLWKGEPTSVQGRMPAGGGMTIGSVGCFLVIESRAHAAARGARALAEIAGIETGRCQRLPHQASEVAEGQLAALGAKLDPSDSAVISGASGALEATREELDWLATLGLPTRLTATALGHSVEPSFVANLALAAIAVSRGALFAPLDASEQVTAAGTLKQALVTGWGPWRGESLALVTRP